jgi:hypothetical protein
MSSVLDTIRRVLGRDRGNRPDPAAQTDAGAPVRAGTAEGVMPPAAGAPALAMPGEEAEAPIQATAPPAMPAMPAMPAAAAEPPVAVSAAMETTEVESAAEPTEPPGPQSDATAEPRGQGNVQDRPLPAPVVLGEETVTHIDLEEPWSAAAAGQATVVEETVQAIVVEGPVAEMEGHEQSLEAEPLASSETPQVPKAPGQSQESATAAPPPRPEGSPEPPTAVESPAKDEDR